MRVLLHDQEQSRWLAFEEPVQVVHALKVDQVVPALSRVEQAVTEGFYAAGYIHYEAGPAMDKALTAHPAPGGPLLAFGLYREAAPWQPPAEAGSFRLGTWRPSINRERYLEAVREIKNHIAQGETYQVNFTFRLRADFEGEAMGLFLRLVQAQGNHYSAYVEDGPRTYCSASPELFFRRRGDCVVCRPMKGTAHRGVRAQEDKIRAGQLRASEKECAENVMIVDMVRNDLGRISRPGSVFVPRLFEVERYPTLLQMTSTVEARTDAGSHQLMGALFPCASITGAPKFRTTEIIRQLECSPRGIYTGTIGFLSPDGRSQFNVAIRTVSLEGGRAEYGLGSGIVWDSEPEKEYEECLLKARVLERPLPAFQLLETMRWDPGAGYYLEKRHLDRLEEAAAYFGFPIDRPAVLEHLQGLAATLSSPSRVRLLLSQDGSTEIQRAPLNETAAPVRFALAPEPVNTRSRFTYHKTTHRALYEKALEAVPGVDDVLLWNRRGQVTEFTRANLVAELDGRRLTPAVQCGLLPGTLRAELLDRGDLEEAIITREELWQADSVYAINSVRGQVRARPVGVRV